MEPAEANRRMMATGEALAMTADEFSAVVDQRARAAGLGDEPAQQVVERVIALTRRETRRRRQIGVRSQIFVGLLGLAMAIGAARAANRWLPLSPKPTSGVHSEVVRQTVQVTPTHTPPLAAGSSPEEIVRKVNTSQANWQSLWVDALVLDYGPAEYIGPPRQYRNQVWFRKPDQVLIVGGYLDGPPHYLRFVDGELAFDFNPLGEAFDRSLGSLTNLNLQTSRSTEPGLAFNTWLTGYYLDGLIRPALAAHPTADLRVWGIERVAGREALLVDWRASQPVPEARLWIDAQTGLILRAQYLQTGPDGDAQVAQEIIITNLALDFNFITDFFEMDPDWTDRLQWNQIWQPVEPSEPRLPAGEEPPPGRQARPYTPAPEGFDPAGESLSFQWSTAPGNPRLPGSRAELIAGGYSLGTVVMGSPWTLVCQRSPDGRRLLYAYDSDYYWLDLAEPDATNKLYRNGLLSISALGGTYPAAFSPDSGSIAFLACDREYSCGLYLQDLETGQHRGMQPKAEAAWAARLAWSADGRFLRMESATQTG